MANPIDGELRTDTWTTLDARLEKNFRLGGSTELAAFGDFLNLFNSDANESVLDRRPGNVNYLVPSRFIAPAAPDAGREVPLLKTKAKGRRQKAKPADGNRQTADGTPET